MNTAENISNKLSYFNELDSISSVSILDVSDDHIDTRYIRDKQFRDSGISLYIQIMIIPYNMHKWLV